MKQVDALAAQKMFSDNRPGEYEVLDVRQDWEYSEMHLPGARLVPLADLPDRIGELDPDRPVLVYCRQGPRSRAAADLLEAQGFRDVTMLAGGMVGWQGAVAEGDPDSGMASLPDISDVVDVYRFGYGMERVLQDFYEILAGRASNDESRAFYIRLAGFEDKHMQALYAFYSQAAEKPLPREKFHELAKTDVAEGGLRPAEYLADRPALEADRHEAFELAMAIEAQAMDFYMRCAKRVASPEAAEAFRRLAREEQAHLRSLGEFYARLS